MYRFMTEGSWSQRTYGNQERERALYQTKQRMLDILNDETGGKFDAAITLRKNKNSYMMFQKNERYSMMLQPEFRELFSQMPRKTRLMTIWKACLSDLAALKYAVRKAK